MPRKLPVYLILFFLSALTTLSAQVEKKVVVEHFTNTRCSICANRNPDFFTNLDNHPDVLHIAIHPSSPYSNCFLNNNNPEENDARTNYYGIYGSTPKLVIQGENIPANADYGDAEIFAPYLGQESPIEMNVTKRTDDMSFYADLTASVVTGENLGELNIFIALVEDTVFYDAPNGEELHFNVFRKRMGGSAGIINLPLLTSGVTFSTQIQDGWDVNRLNAIIIIQDPETKEVIQASKTTEFTFPPSTAVSDIELKNVKISPNPVQNQLNISLESNTETEVRLIDLTGRTISTAIFQNETQINTSELAKGIYFVELKNEEGRLTQKIVKK